MRCANKFIIINFFGRDSPLFRKGPNPYEMGNHFILKGRYCIDIILGYIWDLSVRIG